MNAFAPQFTCTSASLLGRIALMGQAALPEHTNNTALIQGPTVPLLPPISLNEATRAYAPGLPVANETVNEREIYRLIKRSMSASEASAEVPRIEEETRVEALNNGPVVSSVFSTRCTTISRFTDSDHKKRAADHALQWLQQSHWQGLFGPLKFAAFLAGSLKPTAIAQSFLKSITPTNLDARDVTAPAVHIKPDIRGTEPASKNPRKPNSTHREKVPEMGSNPDRPIIADVPDQKLHAPSENRGQASDRKPRILGNSVGNHILTTALNSYHNNLYLNNLFGEIHDDEFPVCANPEFPSIPYGEGIYAEIQNGFVVLGGQTLVGHDTSPGDTSSWIVPIMPHAPLADVVNLEEFVARLTHSRNASATPTMVSPSRTQKVPGTSKEHRIAQIASLPERDSEPAMIPNDMPQLASRYGIQPSLATVKHWNLYSSLREDIVPKIPVIPHQAPSKGNYADNNFGATLVGVQPQSQFQETDQDLSVDEKELKESVIAALEEAGYLETIDNNRRIRALTNVSDGKLLIKLLRNLTPNNYDIFDLLEKIELHWHISLGEWCDGKKNINATLRTYALWESREGSKEASLIHPAGGRANIVMQVNDLFDRLSKEEIFEFLRIDNDTLARIRQAKKEQELIDALPSHSILARLFVETRFLNIFLEDRPGWLDRILGDRSADFRDRHKKRLPELNQMTEQAIYRCLQNLLALAHKATTHRYASA